MSFIVQNVLQGRSGLPEDRYVNTFAFMERIGLELTKEEALAEITPALAAFYTDDVPQTGTVRSIQYFLADILADDTAEVRVYDFGDATPRPPAIDTYTLTPDLATPMPSEVAVCGSFFANRNLPRQRGRQFFGPLNSRALVADPLTGVARPGLPIRETIAGAQAALAFNGTTSLQWCVLSRSAGVGTFQPVTDGWVDDAFDTQRRRGEDPTTRVSWTNGNPV